MLHLSRLCLTRTLLFIPRTSCQTCEWARQGPLTFMLIHGPDRVVQKYQHCPLLCTRRVCAAVGARVMTGGVVLGINPGR